MELLLFIIPFLLISTIHAQDEDGGEPGLVLDKPHLEIVRRGESFSVTCSLSDATPGYVQGSDVTYTWFDPLDNEVPNNQAASIFSFAIGTGQTLISYSIEDDHAGLYKCRTTFNGVSYETNITIQVQSTIDLVNCPVEQKGLKGEEGKLSCSAASNAITMWLRNGQQVKNTTKYRLDDKGLTILNVNDADAGPYTYIARSSTQTKVREITFKVIVAPRIVKPIGSVTGYAGDPLDLDCTAFGIPPPEIQWFREGSTNKLVTGDRLKVSVGKPPSMNDSFVQGILTFDPLLREDGEYTYTCKAVGVKLNDWDENAVQLEAVDTSPLTVHIRPIVEPIADTSGTENGQAVLTCTVRGFPVPTAVWEKVGTDLMYNEQYDENDISVSEEIITDEANPGKIVNLQFKSLKNTDTGEYKCVARNLGGQAEGTANLRVKYSPHFNEQTPGPFYTWLGNTEGFLPCIAVADPAATFRWYKVNEGGEEEIKLGNPDFTMTREVDADNPLKVTGKLMINYDGSNRALFGEYRCEATNEVSSTSQTLLMQEGLTPGAPIVAIEPFATRVILLLSDGPVQGPDVLRYKIIHTNTTGPAVTDYVVKTTQQFYQDGSSSLETTKEITGLKPRQKYNFRILAINAVGEGNEFTTDITTKPLSVPERVNVLDQGIVNPTSITVTWDQPDDGGSPVLTYMTTYQLVQVNSSETGYKTTKPLSDMMSAQNVSGLTNTISVGIKPDSWYHIRVAAVNSIGKGEVGDNYFRTSIAEDLSSKSTDDMGISTAAIIGILIAVFIILFIIVDVFCYFKSNCGVLMTIREALGGGRGEEGYSAAKTDDVENLAKKDELTEEAKAAEENEMVDGQNDEKKEPLLSEEQKVDTVDEVDKPAEKEMEPAEKEEIKPEPDTKPEEAPPTEGKTESAAPESTEEKPSEPAQD